MKPLAALQARRQASAGHRLYTIARLLLLAWALGLAVAAAQLGTWRQELSRTLVQLNADAQFRARAQHRDAVDPEWYRRKALSLLKATERLHRDTAWTLFVPGSWQVFDDLEEKVEARIGQEFGEIVVETIRRELHARASQLTGVPQVRGAGDLRLDADCRSPIPQTLDRKLGASAEDLPEFVAIADYVRAVESLDAAMQAFLSLQHAGGQPEQLRKLVAYTLATELPGTLAHGVRLFHGPDEVNLQPALMQTRLQWATRCSLAKAMGALHVRLLQTNDLLVLEQGLAERSSGLFDARARPAAFDRTLERYRAVHGLLEDQHKLLAKGRNEWMRSGSLQLGPAYQDLMDRIARTQLLGPDVVLQLHAQSRAAFADFRRQFETTFGGQRDPGIVWLEPEQRFGLSPQRTALRTGFGSLLQMSFMSEDGATPAARARTVGSLAAATAEAQALAEARARFLAQTLPEFPGYTQPAVSRVVDARVSELVYQKAYRALKAGLPADARQPLDPAAFRQQREQVATVQAVLKETGGAALGDRLAATLDAELLRRFALLQEDWQAQPLYDARGSDFAWWQGDALATAQALGAADIAVTQASLARLAARLATLTQQSRALLALAGPALAQDPSAQRWQRLQQEMDRYRARQGDSSLLRLELYLAALGNDLRRDNCAERLAVLAPQPAHDDDVAQRHVQVHNALANRCLELRMQANALPPVAPLPVQQ